MAESLAHFIGDAHFTGSHSGGYIAITHPEERAHGHQLCLRHDQRHDGAGNTLCFSSYTRGAYTGATRGDLMTVVAVLFIVTGVILLDGIFLWLKSHLRAVAITIFTVFGLFFLIKGATELLG